MTERKRDAERVPVSSLPGEVKVYQPMAILDVSHRGVQIETPFPLQLDSLHDFRIALGERSIVVKGRIAHCHIGELKEGKVLYRSGVEFVELTEHVRSAILHFVTVLKQKQHAPSIIEGQIADET